ncbi:MAG: DUF59 domain-containing protein [Candidatus Aenigmarchaeota archaeon]|nr:DUF59 domain-containing protein [Candidatus Aenigmarchaeota archaeon]
MPITKEKVLSVLKDCYDPEIPINIVDLGLVYDVKVSKDKINVKMTLTSPGCHLGSFIQADVKNKLLAIKGVRDAQVDVIFDPPWSPEKMSEAAKKQLGVF